MTHAQAVALLPLIVLGLAAVIELLVVSFHDGERACAAVAMIGLLGALGALPIAHAHAPQAVTALLALDDYALFYIGLVLVAGLGTVALVYRYLAGGTGELYLLVLLGTLGAAVLAASVHFASFFLGLELLSVSLYALIAYRARERRGIEAGLKYLVLAAVSAAFLVFGMALVYAERGALDFAKLAQVAGPAPRPAIELIGAAFILTGVGFKLALVPFHLWIPDVYQGAPAPVSGFIATASKVGVFAVLLRFFLFTRGVNVAPFGLALALIAGFSMFGGNLLALYQTNVKRILAYSSIAHFGYLLVALVAGGALAVEAIGYYLATYVVTLLAAFGVVAALSDGTREAETLDDYRGLFWRRPALAMVLTAALLSLASIPLTGGFVAKLYVVAAGASASRWALLVILAVNSAIGLYYYLRIIVAMYTPAVAPAHPPARIPLPGGLALAALALAIVWLGVYPAPMVRLVRSTAPVTITAAR